MALFMAWISLSAHDILRKDPRMVFYASGTVCANISCRLIVAQMSNTRAELFNVFLVPLTMAVTLSGLVRLGGLPIEVELTILYALSLLLTLLHLHCEIPKNSSFLTY